MSNGECQMQKGARPREGVILLSFGLCHLALTPLPPASSLALFLLGHRIGEERSEITKEGGASVMRSHFEYSDRGTRVALESSMSFAPDFTPLSFESHGKSYRYFSVDASVPNAPTSAKVT